MVVSAVVVVVSSVLTTGDGTVDVAAVSGSAAQDPMMKVEAKIIANLLMLPPAQWRRILSVGDGVGSNICSDCVLGERIRRVALSHEFLLDGGSSGGAILHLPPATTSACSRIRTTVRSFPPKSSCTSSHPTARLPRRQLDGADAGAVDPITGWPAPRRRQLPARTRRAARASSPPRPADR